MTKWEEIKTMIKDNVAKNEQLQLVLDFMEDLEKKEKKETGAFYFSDIPTFDQLAWERILEEKGLQGLS